MATRPRVLIIDEDPLVRSFIATALRGRGHPVLDRERLLVEPLDEVVVVDLREGYLEHEQELERLLLDLATPVAVVAPIDLLATRSARARIG